MSAITCPMGTQPPAVVPWSASADRGAAPACWRLERGIGVDLEGCATVTEHWLQVDFALGLPAPVSAAMIGKLLGWSGLWPGVKFCAVAAGGGAVPILRGEMALGPHDARRRERLAQLHQDLAAAWEACASDADATPAFTDEALEVERLRELCLEAQWPAVIGPGGGVDRGRKALTVPLEAGRFPCLARFAPQGPGMVLWAEWTALEAEPGSPAERALGAYLLAASGAARLAALAVDARAGRRAVVARTSLARDATAEQIGCALAALSVAARLCGPEVVLLQEDPELALAWMSGWSAVPRRAV